MSTTLAGFMVCLLLMMHCGINTPHSSGVLCIQAAILFVGSDCFIVTACIEILCQFMVLWSAAALHHYSACHLVPLRIKYFLQLVVLIKHLIWRKQEYQNIIDQGEFHQYLCLKGFNGVAYASVDIHDIFVLYLFLSKDCLSRRRQSCPLWAVVVAMATAVQDLYLLELGYCKYIYIAV